MTSICVSAAIIEDAEGRILICQRGPGGDCAFLWEFPGGKVEPGESPEDCVVRECLEELNLSIRLTGLYAETSYTYPQRQIHFTFFKAQLTGGQLRQNVHQSLRWVFPQELGGYTFCPADVELVNRLQQEG